jgi:hypothetical protein
MSSDRPPDFFSIADASTRGAFLKGYPDVIQLLEAGTRLYKWSDRISSPRGISPWWSFVDARILPTRQRCPSVHELRMYASRLGVEERDYFRTRFAVDEGWENEMRHAFTIELARSAWGYIGQASGQTKNHKDEAMKNVYFIGGEFQVWVPGLTQADIRKIS